MKQIIYMSPYELGLIRGISKVNNSKAILKYLDEIDYHSILLSTLYQGGVDYFEIGSGYLPPTISENPFWSKRIIEYNHKALDDSYKKATNVLDELFYHEVDKKYNVSLYQETLDHLTKLFYSLRTGTPHINPQFNLPNRLELLEPRMDKSLFSALQNINSTISDEKIHTITPTYSVLRKDVKRFEEICETKLFKEYSNSLKELSFTNKINNLKKDISVKSFKLFNKYGNNLNFKETIFSFIKFNKKILDIFASKIPSMIGDFIVSSAESLAKEKKKIYFYEVTDARYWTLMCNRIDEIIKKEGFEKYKEIMNELKNEVSDSSFKKDIQV